jgi:hypothetical protein
MSLKINLSVFVGAGALFFGALGIQAGFAANDVPMTQKMDQVQSRDIQVRMKYSLACRAQGTPSEFPDDIVVINNGPGTVPSGSKIHWTMASPAHSGDYTLTAALAATKGTFIDGVLPGGVEAGKPCTAKVM